MLEVGKKYKTKNGCTFECLRDDSETYPNYPFFGRVSKSDGQLDRFAFYMAGGRYKQEAPSGCDIAFK